MLFPRHYKIKITKITSNTQQQISTYILNLNKSSISETMKRKTSIVYNFI